MHRGQEGDLETVPRWGGLQASLHNSARTYPCSAVTYSATLCLLENCHWDLLLSPLPNFPHSTCDHIAWSAITCLMVV